MSHLTENMEDNKAVCNLSMSKYPDSLLKDIYLLQKEGKMCDVKLQTSDGYILAHRLVLIAASPFFKDRLMIQTEEEDMTTLYIDDTDHITLRCMMNYIYSGSVEIPNEYLQSFVRLCDHFMLPKLSKMCLKCLEKFHNGPNGKGSFKKCCKLKRSKRINTQTVGQVQAVPCKQRKRRNDDSSKVFVGEENEKEHLKIPKLSIGLTSGGQMKVTSHSNGVYVERTERKHTAGNDARSRTIYRKSSRVTRVRKVKRPCENGVLELSDIQNRTQAVVEDKFTHQKKVTSNKRSIKAESRAKNEKKADTVLIHTDDVERTEDIVDSGNSEADNDDERDHINSDNIYEVEPSKCLVKETQKTKVKTQFPKECKVCHEMLNNYKVYTEHMKTHKESPEKNSDSVRKEGWPCSACSRVLTSAVRQACHEHSKHGIPYDPQFKLHQCTYEGCKYITASKHYLQIHTAGRHSNERPHVCEFCGKGFKLPSALITHLNIHTNAKKYLCQECDLTFNQKGGLDIHIKKHHKGQESWTELCHLCSEKFLQKAELCWHMYQVHQIPVPDRYKVFSCELCDYQTIRKNKLERHMDAHDDKRTFVCGICGKKFVTKSYLSRHVKYHGEKKFKCDFEGCNYACVDKLGLRKHTRLMHTHKNFKPFLCSICPYKTGLRGNLDKHIRTVHNLEVVTKHTVHLRMKFKDRNSGDIITKDGKLVQKVMDTRKPISEHNYGDEEEPGDLVINEEFDPGSKEDSEKNSKPTLTTLEASDTHTHVRTAVDDVEMSNNNNSQYQLRDFPPNFMLTPSSYGFSGQMQIPTSVPGDARLPTTVQTSSQSDMYMAIDPLSFNPFPHEYLYKNS